MQKKRNFSRFDNLPGLMEILRINFLFTSQDKVFEMREIFLLQTCFDFSEALSHLQRE